MMTHRCLQTTRARVAWVGCSLLLGVAGAALAVEGYLLVMPLPGSATGRAWRTFGLTVCTTGVVAGLVGSLAALVARFPLLYVEIAGVLVGLAGLALGSLVGLVVSPDGYRREAHPA